MFGLSSSLISGAFGAITGFIFKVIALNKELQASERKHAMDMIVLAGKDKTREIKDEIALLDAKSKYEEKMAAADPHRSLTRRVIAYLLTVGLVFFLPYLFFYGPPTFWFEIVEYTKSSSGFFGIGAYSKQVFEVIGASGIPLAWLYAMLDVLAMIGGFYFGGSLAKSKNPYLK